MPVVTARTVLEERGAALKLVLRAGESGLDKRVTVPRIQKPGLAFAGYLPQTHPERVQVVGSSELGYLARLDPEVAAAAVDQTFALGPACAIVTNGATPPPYLVAAAARHAVPLFTTELKSSVLIHDVTAFLESRLAPRTQLHGVLVEVFGLGILLLGKSGIGKSEAALDLVTRGHRLVADDVVVVRRISPGVLRGRANRDLTHHMEIRGLGIIDVAALFGTLATREEHDIDLVVELCEWTGDSDRLGLSGATWSILEVTLPLVRIPVRPGRSLALLIETAVRDRMLRDRGTHAAAVFVDAVDRLAASGRGRG